MRHGCLIFEWEGELLSMTAQQTLSSLPGLTRQSMGPHRQWQFSMDARVKPAHDEEEDYDDAAEHAARRTPQLFPSPLAGEGGVRVSGCRVRGSARMIWEEEAPSSAPR
jgi:hypothetical protein